MSAGIPTELLQLLQKPFQFFKQVSIFLVIFLVIPPNILIANATMISSNQGMVVTEQNLATQAGVDILRQGGNAIDAAVAVGYALAVVNPCCGNIGGGGMMTIHLASGKNIILNFRERAPLAATPTMFLDAQGKKIPNKSIYGYAAVGIPGTVLGLDTALKNYGTMSRAQVMAPAIHLAQQGFVLQPYDVQVLNKSHNEFRKDANAARIFLNNNRSYQSGERLVQSQLANTLRGIAKFGPSYFYQGPVAKEIVASSQQHGGIMTLKDFSQYYVETLSPLYCHYADYDIITVPPPSSGGVVLCEMLNILQGYPIKKWGRENLQTIHYIIASMRHAFYDRNQLGDPDFVNNPVSQLLSQAHAAEIRQEIKTNQATPSRELNVFNSEGEHTTHYSVTDRFGNAVSATYTLNNFFGAGVIAGNTGFFLNDEMDDFATATNQPNKFGLVQDAANVVAGGKRPLSSITPSIILHHGVLSMVLGSPGGPKIVTSVLLTFLNVIDFGMNIQEAINTPRYHQQWLPDVVLHEHHAFSPEMTQRLYEMGYSLVEVARWGAVEAIWIDPVTHLFYGANDPRRPEGSAKG